MLHNIWQLFPLISQSWNVFFNCVNLPRFFPSFNHFVHRRLFTLKSGSTICTVIICFAKGWVSNEPWLENDELLWCVTMVKLRRKAMLRILSWCPKLESLSRSYKRGMALKHCLSQQKPLRIISSHHPVTEEHFLRRDIALHLHYEGVSWNGSTCVKEPTWWWFGHKPKEWASFGNSETQHDDETIRNQQHRQVSNMIFRSGRKTTTTTLSWIIHGNGQSRQNPAELTEE